MKIKDVYQVKNLEWWEQVDNPLEEGRKYHASNIERCAEAVKEYKELNRPLRILAVHGSGRSGAKSCAHEQSNSQTLLRSSLVAAKTTDPSIEIEEVNLKDYMIEPCNSCYSTASPLCNFPCTCIDTSERILTDQGWKPLSAVGNCDVQVLDGTGSWHFPLSYVRKGVQEVFRIETIEGYSVHATANHEIYLAVGGTRRVDELKRGDRIALVYPEKPKFSGQIALPFNVEELNNHVPFGRVGVKTRRKHGRQVEKRPGRFNFPSLPNTWSLELGEVLGYLLGDGSMRGDPKTSVWSVSIVGSVEDEIDVRRVFDSFRTWAGSKSTLKRRRKNTTINGYKYRNRESVVGAVGSWSLFEFLRRLGLDKQIPGDQRRLPESLWQAPEIAIRGFLRGLFATDGSISIRRTQRNAFVSLYSISLGLLEDVQRLLLQYGIRSTICSTKGRSVFSLVVVSVDGVARFRDLIGIANRRKQAILDKHRYSRRGPQVAFAKVRQIVPLGPREVADLSMPVDHSFVAGGIRVSNCFPGDQMQLLYPKVLRSDILLCSTGVNQATMHGRLKNFCDRLISLDGGTFVSAEQFAIKDKDYKSRMQALEASGKFAYDQRLYGRVAAYFISSKDERQELPQANASGESLVDKYGYLRLTAEVLKDGFESYGYFHAEDFFAGFAPEANVQMMYDKDALNMDTEAISHGKKVVSDAIVLAKKLKKSLPLYKQDRINRT